MTDRLEIADVTCAANVTSANPTEVALGFPIGVLRAFTIVIPDGHSGLTGIALGYGHTPTVPRKQPAFISGNDEVINFPYKDNVPGVPWSAFLVNLDTQPHVWEVRFWYDELPLSQSSTPAVAIPPLDIVTTAADLLGG